MAGATVTDGWDPRQYERFAAERAQPFFDLLDLVDPVPGGDAIDLGCGTGKLTIELHRRTGAARTTGIDSSPAMLDAARRIREKGLSFRIGDLAALADEAAFDLVFANASLQWVPDLATLLARLARALRPHGQLAAQVPANGDHASHTVANAVAHEEPFVSAMTASLGPDTVATAVLAPERYAQVLDELGFRDQHVRLQVYGHRLESTAEVVEWTKGTALVRFRRLLPEAMFDQFVDRYRTRLLDELGEQRPYFYAFKRILFWGRRERR